MVWFFVWVPLTIIGVPCPWESVESPLIKMMAFSFFQVSFCDVYRGTMDIHLAKPVAAPLKSSKSCGVFFRHCAIRFVHAWQSGGSCGMVKVCGELCVIHTDSLLKME